MTTDPKDAETARLTAALAESEAATEGALMILVQTQAERDAALAQVAGAYEAAAQTLDSHCDSVVNAALGQRLCCSGHHCGCMGADVGTFLQHLIRQLTPADALASLSRRDAQMRAEGMRMAADMLKRRPVPPDDVDAVLAAADAILAAAEKEASDDKAKG